MDYEQSLDFLESLFPGRAVVYVPEIVEAFGKSDIAVRRAIERKKLPVKPYMGKIGVSLPDLAQFISVGDEDAAEKSKPVRKSKVAPASAPSKPSRPIRGMASMISAIAAARLQSNFFNELAMEMEKFQLQDRVKRKKGAAARIPRGEGKKPL